MEHLLVDLLPPVAQALLCVACAAAADLRRKARTDVQVLSNISRLGRRGILSVPILSPLVTTQRSTTPRRCASVRTRSSRKNAYLCGATHDFDDPAFPLLAYAMEVGPYAWICARACVAPGVNIGEGAILGLASVATRDLEPWGVYAGSPASKVKERKRVH